MNLPRSKTAQSYAMCCAYGAKAKSQYIARDKLHENIVSGEKQNAPTLPGGFSYFTQ
jgi:hypothetical protein